MNMGSTSTKLAVYEDEINIWTKNITHDKSAFKNFTHYTLQYDYRKAVVLEYLKSKNENLENFTAFVSRGGTIRPVSGGVFYISEQMIEDGLSGKYGDHPCNLSMKLAFELAVQYRAVALTVDPQYAMSSAQKLRIQDFQKLKGWLFFMHLIKGQ